ncbi:MAG: zinc ribbon domain-containing protein [Desulfatirhabdiaceae bacterium]
MFETREQVLEQILANKKPLCPHCQESMKLWEVPSINVGDGLGWGVPFLYLCFNDDCPLYVQGWANLKENYSHNASYRCMNYPGTEQYELMPVFSPVGGTGQIIDDKILLEEEILKENTKKGFSILADCFVNKDSATVMSLLLDPTQPSRVRLKAAEMIGDIGETEAVEPLRSIKVGNRLIQEKMDASVQKIHARYFTRECPFCAEVIKQRANVCKHCGKDVAGC